MSDVQVKTLRNVMPSEFSRDYRESAAYKHAEVVVLAEHWSHEKRWPGTQKNVHCWAELANGKAVGWNENPATGWSFPVVTLKKSA